MPWMTSTSCANEGGNASEQLKSLHSISVYQPGGRAQCTQLVLYSYFVIFVFA